MTAFSQDAARAQAFGATFTPLSTDAHQVDRLLRGELELAPHRAWTLPESPTWSENPVGEINWSAQFHMLRWLDPLRRLADQGDPRGVHRWVALVHSWIAANPPGAGRSPYSWGDMVEAVRAMTMCFALPMLADHRPEALETVLASVRQHGEWLADPRHIRGGNHALQQHQGLLVVGAVLQVDDWVDVAIARMSQMLVRSYDDQGINEEGAVQYHQINYNWWTVAKRRIEVARGGSPVEFRRIERAPLGMAHATRPDGTYELIGDTEVFAVRGIPHPAVEYVASGGRNGIPPPERVKVYSSGYVFGRSGWGDERKSFADHTFYSLRFGPQDRIHGHMDGGSLTLYHRGASVLVDGGKYAYDPVDPFRAHVLSRAAHNSVLIDGLDYDRTHEVRLTRWNVRDAGEDFELIDAGYPGVRIRRRVLVLWDLEAVLVEDDVTAAKPEAVTQIWQLSPAAGHRRDGSAVLAVDGPRRTWFLPLDNAAQVSVVRGRTRPYQGWTSPRWREKTPTRTILVTASGTAVHLSTLIDLSGGITAPRLLPPESDAPAGCRLVRWTHENEPPRTVVVGPDWFVTDRHGADPQALAALGRESFSTHPLDQAAAPRAVGAALEKEHP